MSKLSTIFHFRNHLSQRTLSGKDVRGTFVFRAGISTAGETYSKSGTFAGRVFAPYSIYKGKAALSVTPVLPTFSKMNSGGLKVDRRGSIMLTFMPAAGERKYDWEKRQVFALSATEVGSLISLGSGDSCEFFHDPSMLSSNAGQVRKSLSVKPNDTGYFISLNVVNNILKKNERFTVPVTTAEFAVMRTAFSFALPHVMGWGKLTNQLPGTAIVPENPPRVVSRLLDSEWDK
ncbi:hypothetical protein NMG60_11035836 [Bertholletia excelsa]